MQFYTSPHDGAGYTFLSFSAREDLSFHAGEAEHVPRDAAPP